MKTQIILDLVSTGAVDLLDSLPASPEKIDTIIKTIDAIRDEYQAIDAGHKKIFLQYANGEKTITPGNPQYVDFLSDYEKYLNMERNCHFDAVFTEEQIKSSNKLTPAQLRAIRNAGLVTGKD